MNKKFLQLLMAGSVLTNVLGGMTAVSAYDGPTDYPDNSASGLIMTMIDVRNNEMSIVLRHNSYRDGVLKGFEFVEGEISDDEIHSIYLDETHTFKTYVKDSIYDSDWQDKYSGEEFTYAGERMTNLLSENTDGTLVGFYLFQVSLSSASLNYFRTRINYSRCTESEQYMNNDGAICRAEIWDDGMIHYQPYIGWDRLTMNDEDVSANKTIQVYESNDWVSRVIGDSTGGDSTDDGTGTTGDETSTTDGETGTTGDETDATGDDIGGDDGDPLNEEETPEIRYVDRIVEVPVIKEVEVPVVREIVKEVPVEKTVVEKVEVEVPVEKTKVEVREIVKEVPVLSNAAPTQAAGVIDGLAGVDTAVESLDQPAEFESNESSEVVEGDVEAKTDEVEDNSLEYVDTEEVAELPILGKEPRPIDNNTSGKIAAILAGIISALALVVLAIVYRRKKREDQIDN